MRIDKNTTIRLGNRNIVKVKLGDSVIWQKSTEPVGPDYFYIESLGDGNTISVKNKGDGNASGVTPTLEYSTDKNTWNTITFDWSSGTHTTELPIKLNTGEKMYFRNDTRLFSISYSKYITFSSTVSSNVGGDIRTLSNYLDVNIGRINSYMFIYLFYNNKYIVDASNLKLPYTKLEQSCYDSMFEGCTSLTSAPELPATSLSFAYSCYKAMFSGCTSLTTAPALPATTLEDSCYSYMFLNCTSLTTAPTLPATTLEDSCYSSMFKGCNSLTTAPTLPATTLAQSCYSQMFEGCTSLTTAPTELPATTMRNYCYSSMFKGCTSLTTAPALPATTLVDSCYRNMFYGCSKLNSITVYAEDISASGCTDYWLSNVASSGTFNNLGTATYPTDSPSGIPSGWTEVKPVVRPDYFYIESLGYGNTISVVNKGDGSTSGVTPTLEYSANKNTWNTITFDWTSGEHTTELPVKINTGEKMYFRNDTRKFSGSYNNNISFSSSVSSNVGGDIRTLSNYLDVDNETKPQEYMFKELFYNNKYIVDASNLRLPYNTIENYCYSSMFSGCTSLTTAPTELPATTLKMYCYSSMFYGCTKLTSAPALPATNLDLGCYNYMFQGCTSLTTTPALPATTLASDCYQSMFEGCTSLTTAPELPATTTKQYCYNSMFKGCTKLTSAPALPATTMTQYCYQSMFEGCTSLTTAPTELPATTLETICYSSMFKGCTSLTTAPELPATTLASSCYSSMFSGCTSLTSAPALPATTLVDSCYRNMFYGCSKLNSITVYAQDISAKNCTNDWLSGVASSGTFNNMGFAPFSKGKSGIPNGWTESIPPIESITVNPDTFTIEFNNETVTCNSTLTITTTTGITNTRTNSATFTVGENTGSTTKTITKTIPYYNSSYDVTIVQSAIQSITANPDTFTIEFNNETVTCNSTLTIATTLGTTVTDTNSVTFTVGENTGDSTKTITKTIPYKGSGYDVTIVQSAIQSITANPDTFTIKSYRDTAKCNSTLTIATTIGTTVTDTNSATITVGKNTGDTTRTLTETIPYKGSSYQITIVQTANDHASWDVVSTGTYPFELNPNGYYESTNKGHDDSYSYATLNYGGYDELVLECINFAESNYDYGIISQPDVLLSESTSDDGATGSTNVFHNFKGEQSANPVQLTIPSDGGSHFITIKFRKDSSQSKDNDSLQFKVIEP